MRYLLSAGAFWLFLFGFWLAPLTEAGHLTAAAHLLEEEDSSGRTLVIDRTSPVVGDVEALLPDRVLRKREAEPPPNITAKISHLNASQQQLFVHWAGEGSDVIICLAKNTQPISKSQPSSVFISYDYGSSFVDKTDNFKLNNVTHASIDKFHNHRRQKGHIIFRDQSHRVLFVTKDFGRNIMMVRLEFEPVEILFYPDDPLVFLAHDTNKTLWITRDFGQSFSVVQEMVKLYFWAQKWPGHWENDTGRTLLVQRHEPSSSTVIALSNIYTTDQVNISVVFKNANEFNVIEDFMFATKVKPGSKAGLELYISFKGGEFHKAIFDSELDCESFNVADVSETRLLVAVSHSGPFCDLYVSEVTPSNQYMFRLSLDRIFCYFPKLVWKLHLLSSLTDEAFTDIHKVKGLRGIYMASQVIFEGHRKHSVQIEPDHLVTLITFDWGGEWKPLTPPKVDERGYPQNCSMTAGCSLHLSQKFSSLYPSTKSVPILSSLSAPGIILATGTVGKSLKGHAGIYMSRDAGLTWRQVLREVYLVNLGDHGGIIIAVKFFKSTSETNELLYSTDEGETWKKYIFVDKPIKVYGLMTEPGENTTVFTVFGSEPTKHSWIIINLDLQNVFKYNCTKEDYKKWSPSSETGLKMACVMGKKETYERRVAHANCYNGKNYDSPITMEVCFCDIEDFECDFGFIRHSSSPECIRNKSSTHNPYDIPETCKPGGYYNRTKGYRKIDGDACVEGYERNYLPDTLPCPYKEMEQFLLIAQKERILTFDLAFLTLPKNQSEPVTLPVKDLQSVIAVDFDMRNNCVYFADIKSDRIGRQCFSGTQTVEYLVETKLGSVEGLALDWISNILYFVDGQNATIEVVRTDIHNSGRMRRTILDKKVLTKPRGIALHPVAGYMYWTDWSSVDPSVCRATLDGSQVTRLFTKPEVEWPNGITVDHISEHIYWVDAKLDYIATADLHGRHFRKILQHDSRVVHPFSVAVFKDNMFWDDWKANSFYVADKDHGFSIVTLGSNLVDLMDLKVFAHSIQEGTNACANNTSCSHLCFAQPDKKPPVCLCPDGMLLSGGKCLCNDGSEPLANNSCKASSNGTCAPNMTSCNDGTCIPLLWKCDGEIDCENTHADEDNCGGNTCSVTSFSCGDGKCIPYLWHCDVKLDCADGSDELDCKYAECSAAHHFECKNKKCISLRWKCDGDDDCKDGSDEIGCPTPSTVNVNCQSGQFKCANTSQCLPTSWKCDGQKDCLDNSDEMNCSNRKCESSQFQCRHTNKCIFQSWICDGDLDCGPNDNSDEENCPDATPRPVVPDTSFSNCTGWMFHCSNKKCIPTWWKCDQINDCGDNSDEIGCPEDTEPVDIIPPEETGTVKPLCTQFQFQCDSGNCIQMSWVCDGTEDCSRGEDEVNCSKIGCLKNQFKCRNSGSCVASKNVCDGKQDCPDGSDELSCESIPATSKPHTDNFSCNPGFFHCGLKQCIPLMKYCDGHSDCIFESDESNCTNHTSRYFQVLEMDVNNILSNSTALMLEWPLKSSDTKLEFCPSIAEVSLHSNLAQKWSNHSKWISESYFLFTDLKPFTNYNLTVYVRTAKDNVIYVPVTYIEATTDQSIPSPPLDVKVVQIGELLMKVTWKTPQKPNGIIKEYVVFVSPPIPPMETSVKSNNDTAVVAGRFLPGITYTFWVVAKNKAGESDKSRVVTLKGDHEADVDAVSNLKLVLVNDNSVSLEWSSLTKAQKYEIDVKPNMPSRYAQLKRVLETKETHINVTELSPGVDYVFHVRGVNKGYVGPNTTIVAKTRGFELPVVPGFTVMPINGTKVRLTWQIPSDPRNIKFRTYAIYYSVTIRGLFEDVRQTTSGTEVEIKDLEACENYFFGISVANPLGPISTYQNTVFTSYDSRAPPKLLWVFPDPQDGSFMIISWSSSCSVMQEPIGYVVEIKEMILGNSSSFTLLPSRKTNFTQRIHIDRGAKYLIKVQTDVLNSTPTTYERSAPSLPTPHQIQVQEKLNAFEVRWGEIAKDSNMPKIYFEVIMTLGPTINESDATIYKANQSPFVVSNVQEVTIYSFAVRTVSEKGFKSDWSEVSSVEAPLGSWATVFESGNVVSFLVPVSLVIIILLVVVAIFAIRHRQLQTSFSSFVNSYYSTRSDAATFTSNDGLDDEDSPVIRGFSDDEPLVIA